MARKAINGYPEKSYYDNTVFNGIVATGDPLNEGSFALLTNFDITDSGKSITPRHGFTTTTFKVGADSIVLSDKILTYRDPNIQRDVVIDLNKTTSNYAFLTDISAYALESNMFTGAHEVINYDAVDLVKYVEDNYQVLTGVTNKPDFIFKHSQVIKDVRLTPIRDVDGVLAYITKMSYSHTTTGVSPVTTEFNYWLKIFYREKASNVGGNPLTADTLVISVVDMTQQTVNFAFANIASSKSIIPDPLRTQEAVNTESTTPTDVNRPILLKADNKYTATKLPINKKESLDIDIVPTFHLQDPSKILTGSTPHWAYRFDIINMAADKGLIPFYKTPWRNLPVGNTITNQQGVNNETIPQLSILSVNPNNEFYTYYVITESVHGWYENTNATTYASASDAEAALYERMRLNGNIDFDGYFPDDPFGGGLNLGQLGGEATALGNLLFAYNKHTALVNTLKPSDIALKDIDSALYNQMVYRFIKEEDIKPFESGMSMTLEQAVTRTVSLTQGDIDSFNNGYIAGTGSITAPVIPLSFANYNSVPKLTFGEFISHATEKEKTKYIRIVFLPFSYRHKGTVNNEPTDQLYLCSIGGIYISGLKTHPTQPTGAIASFNNIASVKKTFTFAFSNAVKYIDAFDNLGTLNIKDLLTHIPRSCFDNGVTLKLYLKPYTDAMLATYVDKTTQELEVLNRSWDASSHQQSVVTTWANPSDVVYLEEIDTEHPGIIERAESFIVFEDRIVTWAGNKVFISDEGSYYYFRKIFKKEFPEEILKVIAFKTILLVFSTQHLYAIHRIEVDTHTGEYTEQGLPEYIKEVIWIQQPVLYNINPERRYLDVIQVYNQMILFYSTEGQLYMIKPSTMIDSETQFGVQYFNKSVNNILANFDQYINERLKLYKQLDPDSFEDYVFKEDIKIKALLDIDTIKIFYTAPKNHITFVLIYDVVNNRYTTYDTLSFSNITDTAHIEGGEVYLTTENGHTYFTLPVLRTNDVDQNVDMHYAAMFKKEPIFTFLDSGNLNLNNHIVKRLRDLHIVLKNLDATKIVYNAEILLDDTIIRPFYAPDFIVRLMNGLNFNETVDKVPVEDMNELFGMIQTIGEEGARNSLHSYYLKHDEKFFEENALLKTETLNSSRLLEYNSSILSIGKVVRIRIQLISKGRYKLQSFGIVYKERRL